MLDIALDWTINRIQELQQTIVKFRSNPHSVIGGDDFDTTRNCQIISTILAEQCTACGQRFDCSTYINKLEGGNQHNDVRLNNVYKN